MRDWSLDPKKYPGIHFQPQKNASEPPHVYCEYAPGARNNYIVHLPEDFCWWPYFLQKKSKIVSCPKPEFGVKTLLEMFQIKLQ